MGTATTFACLGVEWLGQCNYNPASPALIYFSLGEVVGALAFTLAVQQLLRQIYIFILSASYLALEHIYVLVFVGVAAALAAAIVPNLPILHGGPWGYAINWELLAAALFVVAYGAVVIALIRPVNVRPDRIEDFAQGAARLLSEAEESDHIDFTRDLQRSLPTLITAAQFDQYEHDTTAFHDFAFRKQIRQAAYAVAFLRLIADHLYCRTLVTRQPWRVANMLREVSTNRLYCRGAEQFVRELAHQAIIRDDSMITREVGYHGFGAAPLLSDGLFADWFIVTQYNPLASFFTASSEELTPMLLKRFNSAAERCYRTLIDNNDIFHQQAAYSIQSYYRSIFMRAHTFQENPNYDFYVVMEMSNAVTTAGRMANRLLAALSADDYQHLFVTDTEVPRADVLETLVEIVDEALNAIAKQFKGVDDPFWIMLMDVMRQIFNSIGSEPDGMTPFQQRLALKLVNKLADNMNGYYPVIVRVLLSAVGPYKHHAAQQNATAFNILKDAMYVVLRRLPNLAQKRGDKIAAYFPPNVTYEVATNKITHAYRGGGVEVTDLSALRIPALSLLEPSLRRLLTSQERDAAARGF
jgi:hypothetical protein